MEVLASVITSLALAMPFLSILWIYRQTKKINSLNGIFSVIIFAYTLWHFFAMSDDLGGTMHESLTGLFVIITAFMNVYCTTYVNINVGVNRRKEQHKSYGATADRRILPADKVIK